MKLKFSVAQIFLPIRVADKVNANRIETGKDNADWFFSFLSFYFNKELLAGKNFAGSMVTDNNFAVW